MDTTKSCRRHMRKVIVTTSLAVAIITIITSNQLSIYASSITEDDGYTYPDDATDEEKEEIDEREQEAWEDAGRPGDNNNDDADDDDNDLPRCAYLVVKDCVLNDLGQTCEVGTDQDACQDIFYGYDNPNYKPGERIDPNKDSKTSGSSSNDVSDRPECVNGVRQECVISAIGLGCKPGYDLSNPSIVGGGHACQDIYAGTYKPESESESKLKDCGDGVVAVSCGVGRYWCSGGSGGDSFHTNDWRDCEDATKKENSSLNNNDNNFNPNNDNNDNTNSDDIPECKRDVLQKCKLSGNTGLLCGVEDLKQGGHYNPNVIGNGHACHDVYIGTYNQLLACKDGTYAVSCGSIGVLPGIP